MQSPAQGAPAQAGQSLPIPWKDILKDVASGGHVQRNSHDSQALKWFRFQGEDPVGVPMVDSVEMDMASMTMEIRSMKHAAKGTQYEFSEDPFDTDAWSWRHFISRIREAPAAWKEHGIARVACVPIAGSYDHNRAANHKGSFGKGVKPPIWDFLVEAGNGEKVYLHPRWGSTQIEMRKHDGQKDLTVVPKAGIGGSDGRGTYKRMTRPVYDERLAAAAETGTTAAAPPPQVVPPRWQTGTPAATPGPPAAPAAPAATQQAATPAPPPPGPSPQQATPGSPAATAAPLQAAPPGLAAAAATPAAAAPSPAWPPFAMASPPVAVQAPPPAIQAPPPAIQATPSGTQATGGVPVFAIAGKIRADTYKQAELLNDLGPWYGATPPLFTEGGVSFWWHPAGSRWFWRNACGSWYQFPDEYHEASAAAEGPGDAGADPIGAAVPGAGRATFVGRLHDTVPIAAAPDQREATPPAFRINPDGTETIFWWHPVVKQWTWYDTAEGAWYGVPRQGKQLSFSI